MTKRWLKEHHADPYVKLAQQQGFRSRAAYKLLNIQEKDRIFKQGQVVLDLGAAPGAWSQVARKFIGTNGKILALDLLSMNPIEGVFFIQGDLYEDSTRSALSELLQSNKVDVVISDMAPNLSGIPSVDQAKSLHLEELALELAKELLKPNAYFVVKCFQGAGFESYLKSLRTLFKQVKIRKPPASRARSSEVYLVAKEFKL